MVQLDGALLRSNGAEAVASCQQRWPRCPARYIGDGSLLKSTSLDRVEVPPVLPANC